MLGSEGLQEEMRKIQDGSKDWDVPSLQGKPERFVWNIAKLSDITLKKALLFPNACGRLSHLTK